ncbi:MAG: thioredoxin [Acidobacteriota bacterium]
MADDIVRCPACGQANHVPPIGSGRKAVCGKCKAPLHSPPADGGRPIDITDATFAATVGQGPIVVDFWAAWCGPCRIIGPVIEQLASERRDVRFGKLNVDENPGTSAKFGVQGIPLLIFFRDGQERGRLVGAHPRASIESAIRQYLG